MELYNYRCKSLRVVDGDTVHLEIDLGVFVKIVKVCRLWGINAPEMKGATYADAVRSRTRLAELIAGAGDHLCCRTHLDQSDKWGRLLVELYHGRTSEISFNSILVVENCAVPYLR